METEELTHTAQQKMREAGAYLRENPVPAIVGALVVGLAIGLVVRSIEREDRAENMLRERWDDVEDYLRANLPKLAKRGKRAYSKSADAVRDLMDNVSDRAHDVAERARDVDIEEYTDPIAKGWRRLWKKYAG